jgi:hypothetical protein
LKVTEENSRIRIRGYGSVSQRYGSADPDPYQTIHGSGTLKCTVATSIVLAPIAE